MTIGLPIKRLYTPHAYLVQSATGQYDLYLLVPCEPNKSIHFNPVVYTNGSTLISGQVVSDLSQTGAGDRAKIISLAPQAAANNAIPSYFFNEKFEISIAVTNTDQTVRKTTLLYEHGERNTPEGSWVIGGLAHNCPYLYLTNPEAMNGSNSKTYSPRCILYLKERRINSEECLVSSAEVGLCEQSVILIPDNNVLSMDVSALLSVNNIEYAENGPIDGSFYAQVLFADSASIAETLENQVTRNQATYKPAANTTSNTITGERKGRILNQSSDSNPTGFID